MKKKILTILSVFSIVASLTACNSATEAVKEPETEKNWEVSTYYMNGHYNPETEELTTVDAAGVIFGIISKFWTYIRMQTIGRI